MGLLNGVNVNLNFGEIARAIKKPGQDDIFTRAFKHNGSIMRLLKPYIIQPTFYVSKNVKRELSSIEHDVITEQVDIFASFIAQAFRVLIGSEKMSERAAVELMSSGGYDYDLMKVGGKFLKRGANVALDKAIASIESRDAVDDATMAFRANSFLTCSSEFFGFSHDLATTMASHVIAQNNAMNLHDMAHMQSMNLHNMAHNNAMSFMFDGSKKDSLVGIKNFISNAIPGVIKDAFKKDNKVYVLSKVSIDSLSKEVIKGSGVTLASIVKSRSGLEDFLKINSLLDALSFLKNPNMNLLEDTEILQASDIKVYEDALKKMDSLNLAIKNAKVKNDALTVIKEVKESDFTVNKDDMVLGGNYEDRVKEVLADMSKNKNSLKKVLNDSEIKVIEKYLATLKDVLSKWYGFIYSNFSVAKGSDFSVSSESYNASMELMFVDDEHLESHINNQVNQKFNALKNENTPIVNRMDTKKTNSRETEISGVRDLKDQEKDAIYGYQIRHFVIRINVESSVTSPEYDPNMMGSKHGASSIVDKPNYTHTHTLSVAKVVEIPITIKANILFVEPEEIINAITYKGRESSFIRRWEEYRSGGIGLWDLIFAGDLVKNYRKNKFKDKQNIINKIASSEIHSLSKIADHGVQGYDRFYNMYCFTAEDAKKLEFYAKSKLSNYGSRQKIMEALNAQQIMILDKEWENGTLYLESLSDSSVIPFKKIGKRGGKDKVNDILEALMANQAPRF